MRELSFRLFACCVPVKGARRSVICDLQRQALFFIPNGLFEILANHRAESVESIKNAYGHEYDREIDEYFEFLAREELGFWCDDPTEFPDLDLTWESPDRITNAIIDVGVGSDHDFSKIFRELDDLGCKAVQLRFYCRCTLNQMREVLATARYGRLRSIEILMPYTEEASMPGLERLCLEFQRISRMVVHSAPEARSELIDKLEVPVLFRQEVVDSPRCCGEVHPGYFTVNIEMFTEAQSFNSCLNRKISIDETGFIRNCPSIAQAYGNIKETSLHGALLQRDFKSLWSINKDQVEVCKDCEFRYVCTDCRAYVSGSGEPYAKPSKCGYDPYTATWR